MQRDSQKSRTTAAKEINSMPFIGHNKNDIKEKTMVEKNPYYRIEESFEKLDEQKEEENEDENKNENKNENDNQNEKKPSEKEK